METDGPLTQRTLGADDVRQLYEQHGAALLLYARCFVADRGLAEDVTRNVRDFARLPIQLLNPWDAL